MDYRVQTYTPTGLSASRSTAYAKYETPVLLSARYPKVPELFVGVLRYNYKIGTNCRFLVSTQNLQLDPSYKLQFNLVIEAWDFTEITNIRLMFITFCRGDWECNLNTRELDSPNPTIQQRISH